MPPSKKLIFEKKIWEKEKMLVTSIFSQCFLPYPREIAPLRFNEIALCKRF